MKKFTLFGKVYLCSEEAVLLGTIKADNAHEQKISELPLDDPNREYFLKEYEEEYNDMLGRFVCNEQFNLAQYKRLVIFRRSLAGKYWTLKRVN